MNLYIIIIIFLVLWYVKLEIDSGPNIILKSSIDNKYYIVKKNHKDAHIAVDIIAKLNIINKKIIEHLKINLNDKKNNKVVKNIKSLVTNYRDDVLSEHNPLSKKNTSYVLNKGDLIKLCIRDKKTGKIHDFNDIVFVNLHELSHIFDLEYGHTIEFWKGFKFILQTAVELGLYIPVNYKNNPIEYCGVTIKNSPYFIDKL